MLQQFYGLSYRRAERLLADSPHWLADISLTSAPDHNLRCNALSNSILKVDRFINRMIDVVTARFARSEESAWAVEKAVGPEDSTCFRSGIIALRTLRSTLPADHRRGPKAKNAGKTGQLGRIGERIAAEEPGQDARPVDRGGLRLSSDPRGQGTFRIRQRLGLLPDFDDLLYRSWKQAPVKVVVADAGYDSEANHCIARQDMSVRSIIPPGIGRPTSKLPQGRWRRHMARRFARKADKKLYGQRSQSETVNSMIKRNQGVGPARSLHHAGADGKKRCCCGTLTHNIAALALSALEEGE